MFNIDGQYRIKVIKRDGTYYHPFGKEWRSNKILTKSLDTWTNIGTFMLQSMNYLHIGQGSTPTDSETIQLDDKYPGWMTVVELDKEDFTTLGCRVILGKYTLGGSMLPEGQYKVREFGIGDPSGSPLLTRIILPTDLLVDRPSENIVLEYKVRIKLPYALSPTPVPNQTGSIDTSGSIKIVGTFDDIFGVVNPTSVSAGTIGVLFSYFGTVVTGVSTGVDFPEINQSLNSGWTIGSGTFDSVTGNPSTITAVINNSTSFDWTLGGVAWKMPSIDNSALYWKFNNPVIVEPGKTLTLSTDITWN